MLVHGDYHHHNLLRHADRWVAIDPKPLIGTPLGLPLDLRETEATVPQLSVARWLLAAQA